MAGRWDDEPVGGAPAFGAEDVQPLLQQTVADAVQDALGRLHREDGLPRFVGQALQAHAQATAEGWHRGQSASDTSAWEAARSACDGALRAFGDELAQAIVQATRAQLQTDASPAEGGGAAKTSGGSWMLAIARAMGEVLGRKASRMVELSQQIQDLSDRSKAAVGNGSLPVSDADRAQQLLDAAESQRLNTEFQATGQEFNLLQTTYSTAMKTLGEGMAAVARRQ